MSQAAGFTGLFDLYILRNRVTNEHYVGISQNIPRRFATHAEKRGPDWCAVLWWRLRLPYYDASKLEKWTQKYGIYWSDRLERLPIKKILKQPDSPFQAEVRSLRGEPIQCIRKCKNKGLR